MQILAQLVLEVLKGLDPIPIRELFASLRRQGSGKNLRGSIFRTKILQPLGNGSRVSNIIKCKKRNRIVRSRGNTLQENPRQSLPRILQQSVGRRTDGK